MAVERARLSMQLASQIRTKVVEAPQDIFHTRSSPPLPDTGSPYHLRSLLANTPPRASRHRPRPRWPAGGHVRHAQVASAPSYATLPPASIPPRPARSRRRSTRRDQLRARRTTAPPSRSRSQVAQARVALAEQRASPAGASRASSCSTSRSSAPPTSSSRSPTSARWRARSPDDRASRASRRAGRSSCCPRTSCSPTDRRRPRPRSCSPARRPASSPGAVRGIAAARRLLRQGPQDRERHDHRRDRPLLWPQGDGAGGGGGGARASRRRGALRHRAAGQPQRDARPDARPGQGAGAGQRRPQRGQDHARQAHVRQKGVAAQDTDETETLRGGGGDRRRHRRHRRQHPDLRDGAARPAATRTTSARSQTVDEHRRRQDGRPTPRSRPARSTSSASRSWSTRRVPPPTSPSIQKAVHGAAGIDHDARRHLPGRRQVAFAKPAAAPKAGPVPAAMLGPLKWVGLGLATLLFLFFMTRHLQAPRGRDARHAGLAARDRGARVARRARGARVAATQRDDRSCRRAAPGRRAAAQALDQLMEREPERVAAQVKPVDERGLGR